MLIEKQRMTGLSLLLLHPPGIPLASNPDIWLEQALEIPSAETVELDSLQATMLYYEIYRIIGDWRPAPSGLIRTAGDVCLLKGDLDCSLL